jgi:formylmethanofuran dehydrogenase subunit C
MKQQITLVLKQAPSLPVEAESINPESFAGKQVQEIKHLPIWCGSCQETVGAYFDVEITASGEKHAAPSKPAFGLLGSDGGDNDLPELVLQGDLSRFKRLGQGMRAGTMVIQGSAGFHAGAMMRGGVLLIQGNAGDWLGAHMEGGLIQVEGSAGHFAGAAYRGNSLGMTGGTILIRDNAGQRLGGRMRRGLIAVGGDCDDMPGYCMLAGTIVVCGKAGIRAGVRMKRGTLVLLQPQVLLPTFYYNCAYRPVFWQILCAQLAQAGFAMPPSCGEMLFRRYSGDANEGGRGEVLMGSVKGGSTGVQPLQVPTSISSA